MREGRGVHLEEARVVGWEGAEEGEVGGEGGGGGDVGGGVVPSQEGAPRRVCRVSWPRKQRCVRTTDVATALSDDRTLARADG